MRLGGLLGLFVLLVSACSSPPRASAAPQRHVFLIVMENHAPDQALSGAFTASLAAKYGVANNYHAISHPSVPNYLALTSGQTWGIEDDGYHVLPKPDPSNQLTHACERLRAYSAV